MDYFSITSQLLVSEAKKLGFEVEILNEDKNFFVIKGNKKEVFFKSNDFGGITALGNKIANDKELTYIVLDRNNITIPKSIYLKKEDLKDFDIFKTPLRFPLVTKPVDEGHGNGVTTNIKSLEELNYGITEAFRFGNNVIIQDYIEGDEHRILVIGNKVIYGIRRVPAFVIGDGKHNIKELIAIENKNPLRGEGYEKPMTYIDIDENLINFIKKDGYTTNSISDKDVKIVLRGISNIGAGGFIENVTQEIGENIKNDCINIAKLIGLELVGVDVVTKDLSQSLKDSKGAVIEINTGPGFGGDFEATGINVALKLLEYIFEIK